MPYKDKEKQRAYNRQYKAKNRERIRIRDRKYYHDNIERITENRRSHPEKKMLQAAKRRAKNKGIEFSITLKDIKVPTHCPIFHIPLFVSTNGKHCDNSPSLDRIHTHKGYIPGNVIVISHRANQIKNNGTADEHRSIADFMSSYGYY